MPRHLKLDHITSPAARDLVELLQLPDFDQIQHQVRSVRGCTRPIRLAKQTSTRDKHTDQILQLNPVQVGAQGQTLTACGNRRASRCPACSRLYAADTYHLIRAGLSGGKSLPEQVRTHPRVFVTLTAPSFGAVHGTTWGGKPRCRCGQQHDQEGSTIGTPLHPATYDYTGAVLWNAHAGALWARFTTYLRRQVARLLNMTQKAAASVLRVSFAKVAEYQQRGLVHFHAIIRFDGPEGGTEPPPSYATAAVLARAVRQAVKHVSLILTSDHFGVRELKWGRQLDVRKIAADDGKGKLTSEAIAGYVAKYATKSVMGSDTVNRPLFCRDCNGRGMNSGTGSVPDPCPTCDGTGRESIAHLPVAPHIRQMIRTCWNLGGLPEFAELRLQKWAHMLGFRGHFSTKSRRYSTTLGALRDARRDWQAEQARIRLGLPDDNPAEPEEVDAETTVIESEWTYIGSGYGPGEELLAEQVRHEIALAREQKQRAKAEGEVWL